MDGGDDGDDDDGDSSRDDADDEDEDEEEEKHLASADSAVIVPINEPVSPPEGTEPVIPPPSTDITIRARNTVRPQAFISLPLEVEVERLLAITTPSPSPPPVPSPLLPSFGCPTQIQTLKIASTQAFIDAVTTTLLSPLLPPLPLYLYIPPLVDRRDDIPEYPAEAVPKIAPMTMGEVNTRVIELAELHEHDTQDLYALLEDAQDSRSRISQRVDMDSQLIDLLMGDRMTLQETV
ncbi:hypothetical protein Tco_1009186 [Tanacetum coccineum]